MQSKVKVILPILFLCLSFSSILTSQSIESDIASLFERQRLLYEVMQEDRPSPVLLIALEVPGADLKRLEDRMADFSEGSRNYGYLLKKKKYLEEKAAADQAFNKKMIEAFKQLRYFDTYAFVPDTALKEISLDSSCIACLGPNGEKLNEDILKDREFIFLQESNHPITQIKGIYFYNAELLYLDNPFPDYIPYRNVFDRILQIVKPGEEVRRPPEFLVKTINEKFSRVWNARRIDLRSIYEEKDRQ